MKALLSVVLLSLLLQLCSAAAVLEPLMCSEFNNHTTWNLAIHHINQHHRHGYKFGMGELSGVALEKVAGGCRIQLQLLLKETTCPTVDPRHFHECRLRMLGERVVVANCSVLITVRDNNATVTRYDCETRQEITNREMVGICPDCPTLIPLNDPKGLQSIDEAVAEFNRNISNERVYVLQEVGRIKVGFIMSTGMNYYSEFLLVETLCPRLSKIVHAACKPLCPDRARYAFCRASSSQMGLHLPLQCEFYPAKNTTALGPGEQEPTCAPPCPNGPPGTPPHTHGTPPHGTHPPHAHGPPPPHAHGTPPPHAHGVPPPHSHGRPPHGPPPPHAHGPPPPHAHGRPPHRPPPPHAHGTPPPQGKQQLQLPFPPPPPSHCMCVLAEADPAIHPICPWPFPPLLHPRRG